MSLHEDVVRRIKRDIITGIYQKGDYLPSESDIAESMGVSRSVVREAARVLRAQGYIDARRGRKGGLEVINEMPTALLDQLLEFLLMGEVSLRQAFDLRLLLELEACRKIATASRPADIEKLRELNDKLLSTRDNEERLSINVEFHASLGDLGGNRMMAIILRLILEFTNRAARLAKGEDFPLNSDHVDQEHVPIVEAIEQGDTEKACRLLERHMKAACERLEEAEKKFLGRIYRQTMFG